jgi:hypothetical protein
MSSEEKVTSWKLLPGEYMGREERRKLFGGALYGGIEPSAKSKNVFLYSDPSRGENFGYKFDGWNHDRSIYLYTGEGRVGDQALREGNRAIANHLEEGRALRVFVADGEEDGKSSAKKQLYLGEFRIDDQLPYYVAEAPDVNDEPRTVFVFRLRPLGSVEKREVDVSAQSDPVEKTRAQLVEIENLNASTFEQRPTEGVTATRTESQLVKRYTDFLKSKGHTVKRWKLLPPGEISGLLTDPFDTTEQELYEAKGSATRNHVRLAVGQLLDYKRLMETSPAKMTVLLPHEPAADLKEFLKSLGIGCVWETEPNSFERM